MQTEFESVNCLICGGEDHQRISDKGAHGFPAHVVICRKCGLVFLNPRWSAERYRKFYETEYDQFYRGGSGGEETVFQIVERLKAGSFFPVNPGKILDIGSGKGASLTYLKNHHYPEAQYFAIEPSVICQEVLKQNGIELVADQIEKDWEDGYQEEFDFVIMRHVLEHFMDPIMVLKKVKSVLKNNGLLYIAVPNALNPSTPLSNHFRNVHTFYFNKWTISNALRLAGLETSVILEGDHFQKHELVCFVVKNDSGPAAIKISQNQVDTQLNVYLDMLSAENSLPSIIKRKLKKILFLHKNR
ncbi:MAG: class I SAM-dependent methyltransferase [Saprospiraceae bacterium]|nr:class I SAM-dependent methyltransferase [Saprospiraceae bacterium]